jgi:hypothetical protein
MPGLGCLVRFTGYGFSAAERNHRDKRSPFFCRLRHSGTTLTLRLVFADPLAQQIGVHPGLQRQARQGCPRLQAGLDQRLLGPRIIVVPLAIITHTNGFKLREIGNLTHEVSTCSLGGHQHDLAPVPTKEREH